MGQSRGRLFGNNHLLLTECRLKVWHHSVCQQRTIVIQVKVNISSVWVITKLICKTWSFCVPLEIVWHAKCGRRAVGCQPLGKSYIYRQILLEHFL